MAAKEADIAGFLAQPIGDAPAIIIYGSDPDFVDSALSAAIDKLRALRTDLGTPERLSADAIAASPAALLDFFNERPLFGDNRFVVITGITERQAKLYGAFFAQDTPAPGPLLLLCSSALTAKSKILAGARASGFCTLIKAYEAPLSRAELSNQLGALGVSKSDAAVVDLLLRRMAGEDPAARAQTLRLLALYAENGRLTAEDLEACLPPGEDQLAGALLAGLLSGDARSIVAWRRQGAAEGSDPVAQLAFIARALGEARRARLAGRGLGEGPPVFWKTDKIVKEVARRISDFDSRLEHAIALTHQIERAARSSEGLIAEKTERLLLRLAQLFG